MAARVRGPVTSLCDAPLGLLALARLQIELAEMLGRDVHLSTPRSLSHYFRDDVIESAIPVYVAA